MSYRSGVREGLKTSPDKDVKNMVKFITNGFPFRKNLKKFKLSKRIIFFLLGIMIIVGVFQNLSYVEIQPDSSIKLSSGFISFDEYGSGENVLILIHGSPGSKKDFKKFAENFQEYKIYAVDMYGFGESSKIVDKYGLDSQAKALLEFMDAQKINKASFLGHSWGGGVVMHLAHTHPERFDKAILLASLGVQEGEPTGNHYLEKARSLISYPFVVFYPGAFAGSQGWRVGFMRSFLDSDLRKIRSILPETNSDFLILHGDEDTIVPRWVAEETNNLLPNSEIKIYKGGHMKIVDEPQEIIKIVEEFLNEK